MFEKVGDEAVNSLNCDNNVDTPVMYIEAETRLSIGCEMLQIRLFRRL